MRTLLPLAVLAFCHLPVSAGQTPVEKVTSHRTAASDLKEGWEQAVEIPEVKFPTGEILLRSATVVLWIEQGWLSVRRLDTGGEVEWQVVLAQKLKDAPLLLDVEESFGGLDLSYGHYFIRENFGVLRVLRQRKDAKSPPWPRLEWKEPIFGASGMPARQVRLTCSVRTNWCWVASGLREQPDVWLKLEHNDLSDGKFGFERSAKPARVFFGRQEAIDEGDLFWATRSPTEIAERDLAAKKVREELGEKPAPAIVAGKWVNSPAEFSLDKLRGKVVLLDFWGTWCQPCVEKLPAIEALHKKYEGRGLVVIGIHSDQAADDVPAFLEKHSIPFTIAIDTGETARSYGVGTWPTYFLIDKSGKVVWGFSSTPPTESQIEELLR